MAFKAKSNKESPDKPNYLTVKLSQNPSPSAKSYDQSRKCFPIQKYGVSPDAPIEFQTKNSLIKPLPPQFILSDEPLLNQGLQYKRLSKEEISEWPPKYIHAINHGPSPKEGKAGVCLKEAHK